MTEYSTRFALSPFRFALSWQDSTSSPQSLNNFEWQYCFQDGSRLVGQVEVPRSNESSHLLHPCHLQASYLGTDGKTVLLQWVKEDFVIFEAGEERLIIASNDNFVSNSVCLVSCPSRSCAQVTHWGVKLVSEPFNPECWSIRAIAPESSSYQVCWQFSPFFPYFGYSLRWQPSLNNFSWIRQYTPASVSFLSTTVKNCNNSLQSKIVSL